MFEFPDIPILLSWIGPAIAAAASTVGGILANKSSAKSAEEQMLFQMHMSNTAHQREVQDLRAAGLNPILSGMGGPGASTPVGARSEFSDVVTPAVNSALAARRNEADVDLLEETRDAKHQEVEANLPEVNRRLTEQQRDTQQSQEQLNSQQYTEGIARTDLLKSQDMTERERLKTQQEQTKLLLHEADIAKSSAAMAARDAAIGTGKYGELLKYIQLLRDATGFSAGSLKRGGGITINNK